MQFDLQEQLDHYKAQCRHQQARITQLEKEFCDEKEYLDKGVQLQLEDLDDFKVNDEIENYENNLNMFILEGAALDEDWATVIITDIISKKAIRDYNDYKGG